MTKRIIVADSCANLSKSQKEGFASVPLKVLAGHQEYIDNAELDVEQMCRELDAHKGPTSTACPCVIDWLEAYGDADEVFGVSLTSMLSGSYSSSQIAAAEYIHDNPGKKVFILDSLSAGPEMTLIAERYEELLAQELSFEEICETIQAYSKRTHVHFMLESLSNFAKNGRVSPAAAKLAGILGIRIVGRASEEGTLSPEHKCRGEKAAIQKLVSTMEEAGFSGGKVRIHHTFNPNAAEQIRRLILEKYPEADVRIGENCGLCSYYAEMHGILMGFESN